MTARTKRCAPSGSCAPRARPRSSPAPRDASGTSSTRWGSRSGSTSRLRSSTAVGSMLGSTSGRRRTRSPATDGCSRSATARSTSALVSSLLTGTGATSTSTSFKTTFISNLPPEVGVTSASEGTKPRAGRLFMGGSVWPAHGPGFLLTGDAAGMINPCNGEGIAYGYETGRIAGRHIDEALRNGKSPSLDGYTKELEDSYGPYYRLGRRFVRVDRAPGSHGEVWCRSRCGRARRWSSRSRCWPTSRTRRAHTVDQRGLRIWKKLAELKP